jgi:hypothetical protein
VQERKEAKAIIEEIEKIRAERKQQFDWRRRPVVRLLAPLLVLVWLTLSSD